MNDLPSDELEWPDFDEPELVGRLTMAEHDFHELWDTMGNQMPPRPFSEEAFALATGYPWPRPESSYLLENGKGIPLSGLSGSELSETLETFTGPDSGRTPMLAIGANGSPEGLWRKFSHFDDPGDRRLLALAGAIHDFDIGASAEVSFYGAMPATLFPSIGTRSRAIALWLTDTQLTQLAWTEIPYWVGRLETRFEFEPALAGFAGGGFDSSLVFVNRLGAFAPDGQPLALAAIGAENRVGPEMSQLELLRLAAGLVLGQGAAAEDLVRKALETPTETRMRISAAMRSNSILFESDRWTPFPGP